jgi:hypothetical protein
LGRPATTPAGPVNSLGWTLAEWGNAGLEPPPAEKRLLAYKAAAAKALDPRHQNLLEVPAVPAPLEPEPEPVAPVLEARVFTRLHSPRRYGKAYDPEPKRRVTPERERRRVAHSELIALGRKNGVRTSLVARASSEREVRTSRFAPTREWDRTADALRYSFSATRNWDASAWFPAQVPVLH